MDGLTDPQTRSSVQSSIMIASPAVVIYNVAFLWVTALGIPT